MPRTPRLLSLAAGSAGLRRRLRSSASVPRSLSASNRRSFPRSAPALGLRLTPSRRCVRSASRTRSMPRPMRRNLPSFARGGTDAKSRAAIRATIAKFGAPSVTIYRADLLGILADGLRSADIRLGLRCVVVAPRETAALRVLPMAARSKRTSWLAPTAFIPRCAKPVRRGCAALHRLHLFSRHGAGRGCAARY